MDYEKGYSTFDFWYYWLTPWSLDCDSFQGNKGNPLMVGCASMYCTYVPSIHLSDIGMNEVTMRKTSIDFSSVDEIEWVESTLEKCLSLWVQVLRLLRPLSWSQLSLSPQSCICLPKSLPRTSHLLLWDAGTELWDLISPNPLRPDAFRSEGDKNFKHRWIARKS